MPFFYWYQLLWIILGAILTASVYLATEETKTLSCWHQYLDERYERTVNRDSPAKGADVSISEQVVGGRQRIELADFRPARFFK